MLFMLSNVRLSQSSQPEYCRTYLSIAELDFGADMAINFFIDSFLCEQLYLPPGGVQAIDARGVDLSVRHCKMEVRF